MPNFSIIIKYKFAEMRLTMLHIGIRNMDGEIQKPDPTTKYIVHSHFLIANCLFAPLDKVGRPPLPAPSKSSGGSQTSSNLKLAGSVVHAQPHTMRLKGRDCH